MAASSWDGMGAYWEGKGKGLPSGKGEWKSDQKGVGGKGAESWKGESRTYDKNGESKGAIKGGTKSGKGVEVKPGDWECDGCGTHNFAAREVCLKCGAYRKRECVIERQMCHFFKENKCRNGVNCPYSHVYPSNGKGKGEWDVEWNKEEWKSDEWGTDEWDAKGDKAGWQKREEKTGVKGLTKGRRAREEEEGNRAVQEKRQRAEAMDENPRKEREAVLFVPRSEKKPKDKKPEYRRKQRPASTSTEESSSSSSRLSRGAKRGRSRSNAARSKMMMSKKEKKKTAEKKKEWEPSTPSESSDLSVKQVKNRKRDEDKKEQQKEGVASKTKERGKSKTVKRKSDENTEGTEEDEDKEDPKAVEEKTCTGNQWYGCNRVFATKKEVEVYSKAKKPWCNKCWERSTQDAKESKETKKVQTEKKGEDKAGADLKMAGAAKNANEKAEEKKKAETLIRVVSNLDTKALGSREDREKQRRLTRKNGEKDEAKEGEIPEDLLTSDLDSDEYERQYVNVQEQDHTYQSTSFETAIQQLQTEVESTSMKVLRDADGEIRKKVVDMFQKVMDEQRDYMNVTELEWRKKLLGELQKERSELKSEINKEKAEFLLEQKEMEKLRKEWEEEKELWAIRRMGFVELDKQLQNEWTLKMAAAEEGDGAKEHDKDLDATSEGGEKGEMKGGSIKEQEKVKEEGELGEGENGATGQAEDEQAENDDKKGEEDDKLIGKDDKPVFGEDGRMAEH